jgi:hypothetical protein
MTARRISLVTAAIALATVPAAAAQAPAPKPGAHATQEAGRQCDELVDAYLHGRWAELAKAQRSLARSTHLLTAQQRDDVAYIRKATAEHRPAWWATCKGGRKARLRVQYWGKSFSVSFAPGKQPGWRYRRAGQWLVCSVFWDPNSMDSGKPTTGSLGRRGFAEGLVRELNIWNALVTAYTVSRMSIRDMAAIAGVKGPDGKVRGGDPKKNLRYGQYQSFAGELAAMYYVSPPARQASLVWCLAPYKLDDMPHLRGRRAIAAMAVATFLEDFSKWPSLKLPPETSGDTEQSTAKFYHFRLHKPWTLAEDRALREAIWKFHHASPRKQVFDDGKLVLPNGMTFLLDSERDAPHQARRDAWVKQQLAKARAGRKSAKP